jgi:hypothetical protein
VSPFQFAIDKNNHRRTWKGVLRHLPSFAFKRGKSFEVYRKSFFFLFYSLFLLIITEEKLQNYIQHTCYHLRKRKETKRVAVLVFLGASFQEKAKKLGISLSDAKTRNSFEVCR